MTRFVPLVVSLTVFACATVGKPFDTTHTGEIQKGVQDKAQITAWFGQPSQTTSLPAGNPAGCVERWQWTYSHSVAGGDTVADALVVDFDAAGKVCDNAFSQVKQ